MDHNDTCRHAHSPPNCVAGYVNVITKRGAAATSHATDWLGTIGVLGRLAPNMESILELRADILELRAEIVHLQTLLVTQTDAQTRSAMLDLIRELERRISRAEESAASAAADEDAASQS